MFPASFITIANNPTNLKLLDILDSRYQLFAKGNYDYDCELSIMVVDFFREKILQNNIESLESELDVFIVKNSDKLTAMFDRYKDDSHVNYMLKQPEMLLILQQMEKDIFTLHEYWTEILPEKTLVWFADEWGVPIYPREL